MASLRGISPKHKRIHTMEMKINTDHLTQDEIAMINRLTDLPEEIKGTGTLLHGLLTKAPYAMQDAEAFLAYLGKA